MPNNPIVQYYDDLAQDYDHDRFGNSYGRFIDQQERAVLAQLLHGHHNGTILDLACGSGRLLDFADIGVDAALCGSFLKAYSSYLIIELQKDDLR